MSRTRIGILAVDGWVLEQAGDFEAAHAGHHQVEDDHVGGILLCCREAGLAVEGALDRVAEVRQLLVESSWRDRSSSMSRRRVFD